MEAEAKNIELVNLLEKIKRGEIQLPDFQRSWVWSDKQIKSLLESVIRGFPINSIMLLECDADSVQFSFRKIELLERVESKPHHLILDGQQRLTSLFGALYSDEPIKILDSKGKVKKFFYYVDMKKAIAAVQNSETDEDMIISVDDKKKLKAKGKNWDLSTPEKEFAAGMFPLNKIFESRKWFRRYEKFFRDEAAEKLADTFDDTVVVKLSSYKVACIMLEKNIPLAAICKIFEKVNIGGVKLSTSDLLTAIFAKQTDANGKPVELRRDREEIKADFAEKNLSVLKEVDFSNFITAVTLLVSYEKFCSDKKNSVSCKSEDILKLDYNDYIKYKDAACEGFIETAKFLEEESITTTKYLPYNPQLIPLAAIFAELKLIGKSNAASRKKIRQWYWTAVFSEAYREGHLARFAKDIVQVTDWIKTDKTPKIIEDVQLTAWKLLNAKKLQSAVYKGLVSIIFKNGAKDFIAGKNMGSSANYAEGIDMHHIFPKKFCEAQKFSKDKYENIANKTLILAGTNRIIGSNAPSVYLKKIEDKTKLSSTEVDEILERHFIDAELCRADNFNAFVVDRAKKILAAVEECTGRKISGRDSPEIKKVFGSSLQ